ncbi:hypothetical protein GW17_00005941, partial [Ensete ventricosum]
DMDDIKQFELTENNHILQELHLNADLLDLSIVAYAIDVLPDSITTVVGCLSGMQNNCIGEKNTRYFMAFLLWKQVRHLSVPCQTFKWRDYISWKRKLNEAKASAAALKAGIQTINEEAKAPESKWRAFFRRSPLQNDDAIAKNNLYDQGIISNICEIVFPLSERKSFFHRKST